MSALSTKKRGGYEIKIDFWREGKTIGTAHNSICIKKAFRVYYTSSKSKMRNRGDAAQL